MCLLLQMLAECLTKHKLSDIMRHFARNSIKQVRYLALKGKGSTRLLYRGIFLISLQRPEFEFLSKFVLVLFKDNFPLYSVWQNSKYVLWRTIIHCLGHLKYLTGPIISTWLTPASSLTIFLCNNSMRPSTTSTQKSCWPKNVAVPEGNQFFWRWSAWNSSLHLFPCMCRSTGADQPSRFQKSGLLSNNAMYSNIKDILAQKSLDNDEFGETHMQSGAGYFCLFSKSQQSKFDTIMPMSGHNSANCLHEQFWSFFEKFGPKSSDVLISMIAFLTWKRLSNIEEEKMGRCGWEYNNLDWEFGPLRPRVYCNNEYCWQGQWGVVSHLRLGPVLAWQIWWDKLKFSVQKEGEPLQISGICTLLALKFSLVRIDCFEFFVFRFAENLKAPCNVSLIWVSAFRSGSRFN